MIQSYFFREMFILVLYIFIVFLQISLAFFILFLTLSFITGAPFVPSSDKAARAMIRLAHIKRGETVYDLGSGNGKLLFLSASYGASAIGFEINPYLVLYTRIRVFFSKYRGQIRVYWKNFWNSNLSDADVIFIYLLPWRMGVLQSKLFKTIQPKTRFVTNSFLFPNVKPDRADTENHVYVYIHKSQN